MKSTMKITRCKINEKINKKIINHETKQTKEKRKQTPESKKEENKSAVG